MFQRIQKEQLIVPAHIDYLGELRNFIMRIGKTHSFSNKFINAFKLTVDEAATNIIRHAYRGNDGFITIRAYVKKQCLTIIFIDQGHYFNPKLVKDPDIKLYLDTGKKGGLGIYIMRKLMDEIDYRKTKEGNELRITKFREAYQKKNISNTISKIALALKTKYFSYAISIITNLKY